MTTESVLARLRERYPWPEYVFFDELRLGTGWELNSAQAIDAWVLNTYPSQAFTSIALEIKVSRGDFLKELKHPEKRQAALQLSSLFYFVTPEHMVGPAEMPEEVGLLWVGEKRIHEAKKPVRRYPVPSWGFMASVCRRVALNGKRNWMENPL
jgi:hypothetical protein